MKLFNNEFGKKQLIGGIVILLVSIGFFRNNPNSSNLNSIKESISPTIQVEKIEVKATIAKENITIIESKITPKSTATPAATLTLILTATAIPVTNTPKPLPTNTPYIPPPTYISVPNNPTAASGYSCNCAKTCPSMSCEEAYYQLNVCGCSARDGDNDGVPCEAQCR